MKESQNVIDQSREIYQNLQKEKVFEAYIRHIYMEIRTNNPSKVFDIFRQLTDSIHDEEQIAFVIQEFGDFLNKVIKKISLQLIVG